MLMLRSAVQVIKKFACYIFREYPSDLDIMSLPEIFISYMKNAPLKTTFSIEYNKMWILSFFWSVLQLEVLG